MQAHRTRQRDDRRRDDADDNGTRNGLAIVAARAYGAGDEDQLKQTVAGSIVIGIIASAVIDVYKRQEINFLGFFWKKR